MKRLFFIVMAVFFSYYLDAQTLGRVQFADSLHMAYDFIQAKDEYVRIMDEVDPSADTVLFDSLREKILLAENGRNMSRYVQSPYVIAKRKFSVKDFFLYYPLDNRSWRQIPNVLDTLSCSSPVRALYAPGDEERIYYSAMGTSGKRDIMMTELVDTVWSLPVVDSVLSTAVSDEIYPLLSPDGKEMYFASEGLYGVGGYDLYRSQWNEDEQRWEPPQNMGFPYSSPADDFMYMETEDGDHILFASNRECVNDSVIVYVIRKEPYPIHSPVTDPEELQELARLDVLMEEVTEEGSVHIPDNELTVRYGRKMSEVKQLRDSIDISMNALEEMRNEYILSNEPGIRIRLTNRILELETILPQIQKSLDQANRELREIEMEFLKEGIFLNIDFADAPAAEKSDFPTYEFHKKMMGNQLDIKFLEPEEVFDYSFRVEDEAIFAEDQTIPSGIIYQVQLFSGGRKALVSELKGLCPVYEHRTASGMYTYRVGLFHAHAEADECLETVRRRGFKDAYIVAFIDGEIVSVADAREKESETN